MKHPFKGCIVAVTGDFGERRGIEKMRQWIQVNGGEFVQHIDVDVTHLICSKEHFLRDVTLGKLSSLRAAFRPGFVVEHLLSNLDLPVYPRLVSG